MQMLEKTVKTGIDYVQKELKDVLKSRIGKSTADNDIKLNVTLFEILTTLIKTCTPKYEEKTKDYVVAAAICNCWNYPAHVFERTIFPEFYKRNKMSEEESEEIVKNFLEN